MADYRLPIFQKLPIRHKIIVCAPLIGPIDLAPYLGPEIEQVSVGGESGPEARVCDYAWVLSCGISVRNTMFPLLSPDRGASAQGRTSVPDSAAVSAYAGSESRDRF